MTSTTVCIRGIETGVYMMAKARSAELGISLGIAVNRALEKWAKEEKPRKNPKEFLEFKPINFHIGSTDAISEIDKVLYEG
ncbi:MAG: hypothetical protein J4432_02615 [DPANN group archaeon]|nr:hypothetical protein [DPANN group archaeon]